jgi:hypothetical protein
MRDRDARAARATDITAGQQPACRQRCAAKPLLILNLPAWHWLARACPSSHRQLQPQIGVRTLPTKLGRRCHQAISSRTAWHGVAWNLRVVYRPPLPGKARCGWRSIIRCCRLPIADCPTTLFPRQKTERAWPGLPGFGWMALPGLISLPLAWTCQIRLDTDDTRERGEAVVLRSIPGLSVVSGRYRRQALRRRRAILARMCHAVDAASSSLHQRRSFPLEEPWVEPAGLPFHVHRPAARVLVLKVQHPSRVKLFKHFTAC